MMKRYLDKVVRLFFEKNYSRKTVNDFHRWLLKEDNEEEKIDALKAEWDNITVRKDSNTDAAFNKFLHNIGMEEVVEERKHININIWKYVSAAAVISGIISTVATVWYLNKDKHDVEMLECYAPFKEIREITLPDGSRACLNSGSYILYPEDFKSDARNIYLVGEAVFEVARNKEKPFTVHSGKFAVTALGTKFNVKAYPEDDFLTATLLKGKIKVKCSDTEDYYLNPGQQLKHNKLTHQNELKEVDEEFVTAWQRGEIILSEASLKEIRLALETRYGVEIKFFGEENLTNDLFSFTFKKDAKIEEVLDIMKIVIGNFDYKIKNNICSIYCNKK